jgi:hypothetical protein
MAGTPVLTPSNTPNINIESWAATVQPATYEKMDTVQRVFEYPVRLLNLGHVRKFTRASATTLAQGADGDLLTASDIADTTITITPVGRYVYVSWSENEDAQVDINIDVEAANQIEQALAEATETACLALATSFTNSVSDTVITKTLVNQAMGRLVGNTNGMYKPGRDKFNLAYSNTQFPAIMNIDEYARADAAGQVNSPSSSITGVVSKGSGIDMYMSTVIASDVGGWHNLLFVEPAIVAGWNVRTRIKRQDYQLNNRVIVFNNVGFAVQHNARAVQVISTTSAL